MKRDPQLARAIRDTAYFMWEQDGRPEEKSFEYWLKAKEAHLLQLAYDRWLEEGSPIGRDLAIWADVAREVDDT